jgi:aromatic-L-amino-acid decarboxylase
MIAMVCMINPFMQVYFLFKVKLRILETDSNFRLRGNTLQIAITEDRNLGLIPFFVSTTLGTTSCCSFDVLSEIGPVCSRNDLWLHVDAAYGKINEER